MKTQEADSPQAQQADPSFQDMVDKKNREMFKIQKRKLEYTESQIAVLGLGGQTSSVDES